MAESELLLSPTDGSAAVELSQSQRTYRKRILPKATINYKGRKITFDASYLNDLANSFKQGAYDQVAFMLADTNNAHTLDPERFRGEVRDVEVGDDGLYATIQVTPQAAEVLKQNPKLGVSARILENYERSDGQHFPRALQHVLGTLDPVIPGLGTWEEVALSNGIDPDNVIDLSATSYEELEQMATRADLLKQVAEATDMTEEDVESLGMTDDELEIFASAFDTSEAPAAEAAADDDELIEEPGQEDLLDSTDTEVDGLPTDEEIEAAVAALSDEELAELAAELGIEDGDDEDVASAEEPEDAEASAESPEETEAAEETETGVTAAREEGEPVEVAEPTDAELAERLASGDFNSGLGTEDPTLGTDDVELDGLSDEELVALFDAAEAQDAAAAEATVGTEEAAAIAAELEEATEPVAEEAPQLAGAGAVSLSNETAPEVVALSNQVNALQQQLAEQRFETMKRDYVRKGVPASLVDLARPVLVAGRALEFSNSTGNTVDPADIVRKLLDSATGYIELAQERGHSYSPEKDDQAAIQAAEDKRLASLWSEQYGR